MVVITNPEAYEHIGFEVNHGKKHKYDAILKNKRTGEKRRISFGAKHPDGTPYEQFHDKLGHYSAYDHGDKRRRDLYRRRHEGEEKRKFSSGWFSWYLLWD